MKKYKNGSIASGIIILIFISIFIAASSSIFLISHENIFYAPFNIAPFLIFTAVETIFVVVGIKELINGIISHNVKKYGYDSYGKIYDKRSTHNKSIHYYITIEYHDEYNNISYLEVGVPYRIYERAKLDDSINIKVHKTRAYFSIRDYLRNEYNNNSLNY